MPKEHQPFKIDAVVNHPLFLRPIRERTQEVGAGLAIAEALQNANVIFRIEGNSSRWENPGQGALFVGDHTTGMESVLLFAMLSLKGRNDVYFTAKPYSVFNHVLAMVGASENDYTIPLMPRVMAQGRKGGYLADRINRQIHKSDLLTEQEIRELNRRSIHVCALHLDQGHGVNIFPAGAVSKRETMPWQRGIGEIVKAVDPEDRDRVMIVPYSIEGPAALQLGRSLYSSRRHHVPKERRVLLRTGKQGTINELFSGEVSVDELTSTEVTAIIERNFKSELR